jgi:lipopolysaccharide assembly protein A
MRYLLWTVRFLVFILVFSFAVKNSDSVTVRYYLGAEWQAPLIFVLLVTFCAGAAFGVLACLGQLFRQRREIARLKQPSPGKQSNRGDAEAQRIAQSEYR